jgi:hypothetical protein
VLFPSGPFFLGSKMEGREDQVEQLSATGDAEAQNALDPLARLLGG